MKAKGNKQQIDVSKKWCIWNKWMFSLKILVKIYATAKCPQMIEFHHSIFCSFKVHGWVSNNNILLVWGICVVVTIVASSNIILICYHRKTFVPLNFRSWYFGKALLNVQRLTKEFTVTGHWSLEKRKFHKQKQLKIIFCNCALECVIKR